MKLFDDLIKRMQSFPEGVPARHEFNAARAWPDKGQNQLIMLKDAAFELGGGSLPSVNCTCVTTSEELFKGDEIFVYGKDLNALNSDISFARLAFLYIDEPEGDDEETYNAIKKLEFVRYNVHPEGYMVRVSAESNQEQVRISKKALAAGISFEAIGNAYIKKYKEIEGVKHVKMIFYTGASDLSELVADAKKVDDITNTLTHILDGIPTDCGSCNLKQVCDEVEGLREMHMKQRGDLKARQKKKEGAKNA